MSELDDVRAGLRAIDEIVASGQAGRTRPWGGAGVVIGTEPLPPDAPNDFYASPRFVVTPYVAAVSWLFEQLWRVFRPVLDHVDKFEFSGRLGNSLTHYHATASGRGTERDAVGAVLHEAYAILDDIASGSFAGPAVTSGYGIHDDAIPQAERPPYVSVEEANRWLENPGDA